MRRKDDIETAVRERASRIGRKEVAPEVMGPQAKNLHGRWQPPGPGRLSPESPEGPDPTRPHSQTEGSSPQSHISSAVTPMLGKGRQEKARSSMSAWPPTVFQNTGKQLDTVLPACGPVLSISALGG